MRRPEDPEARGAGSQREGRNAGLHGARGDVSLGEGAVGAEPVGLVGPLEEVPKVVHQVGRALHEQGEEQAQQGCAGVEPPVGVGQRRGNEYQDHGVAERVGPDGQYPCGERVRFHELRS